MTPPRVAALCGTGTACLFGAYLALCPVPPLLAFIPGATYVLFSLLALILAAYFKDKTQLILWTLALSCFLVSLLPYHQNPPADEEGASFSLITWNINAWKADLPAVAAFLKERNDDVICLQEMHKGPPDNDPRPAIRNSLNDYQWLQGYNSHRNDIAILSKFPMQRVKDYALDKAYGLLVRIDAPEGSFHLMVVHLHRKPNSLPQMDPGEQWRRLNQVLERIEGPLVVAGDFNAPPSSKRIAELSTSLQDLFAARGQGFGYTFPAALPCLRLDYVFCREMPPLSVDVPKTKLSDHLPLATRLKLGAAPERR